MSPRPVSVIAILSADVSIHVSPGVCPNPAIHVAHQLSPADAPTLPRPAPSSASPSLTICQ
jgi:hypothetical protein